MWHCYFHNLRIALSSAPHSHYRSPFGMLETARSRLAMTTISWAASSIRNWCHGQFRLTGYGQVAPIASRRSMILDGLVRHSRLVSIQHKNPGRLRLIDWFRGFATNETRIPMSHGCQIVHRSVVGTRQPIAWLGSWVAGPLRPISIMPGSFRFSRSHSMGRSFPALRNWWDGGRRLVPYCRRPTIWRSWISVGSTMSFPWSIQFPRPSLNYVRLPQS